MQDDQENEPLPISVIAEVPEVGSQQLAEVDGGRATADADANAESSARDLRTVQVADHGVDVTPVPPAAPIAAVAATTSAVAGGTAAKRHARRNEQSNDRFTVRDFFLWCGVPVLIVILVRIFLLGFYEIPSRSMMDTIVPGDRVVASKLTPKYFDLQRGDVVVFKDPNNWLSAEQSSGLGGGFLIKRLIGLPGDVVECKGAGQPITINGVAINESSYIRPGVDPSAFPFSVTVTEGHVFVMGDNRANSADSRYHQDDGDHGLVPISDIVGTGLVTYWPLDRIGVLDAHHDVFANVPNRNASAS
ncbi:signal peptidase I [Bifidobacterium felsineum]|uniref:Signal peptidase I n=1 Tax=Bifidobacterium felsineum TaxID=2045440 RepID=A0A2M9HIK3_9BIFI|nr:signal peptidase I [Bifidobacterium felsineum]MBT1164882.1 signal peptidase I [Bifidobacterium felsineum]PJM76642.1 signal peptidase I [Bifidobacterium felsineum]